MPEPELDILDLLRVLAQHKVEFIVVGGVAALNQLKERMGRDRGVATLAIRRRTLDRVLLILGFTDTATKPAHDDAEKRAKKEGDPKAAFRVAITSRE